MATSIAPITFPLSSPLQSLCWQWLSDWHKVTFKIQLFEIFSLHFAPVIKVGVDRWPMLCVVQGRFFCIPRDTLNLATNPPLNDAEEEAASALLFGSILPQCASLFRCFIAPPIWRCCPLAQKHIFNSKTGSILVLSIIRGAAAVNNFRLSVCLRPHDFRGNWRWLSCFWAFGDGNGNARLKRNMILPPWV